MGVIERIPTCMFLCVLVVIFARLRRHSHSTHLTLWTVGWTLVFVHFLAELLEPSGRAVSFLLPIDRGALQAAAVVFVVSACPLVEDRTSRTLLFLTLVVPSVSYAVLRADDVHLRWPYALCLFGCIGAAAYSRFRATWTFSMFGVALIALGSLAGAWALQSVFYGSFSEGMVALLGVEFGLAGALMCKRYRRLSPATMTICGGFFCWGAVFPILYLLDRFAPNISRSSALWDSPQLFVAFGMILELVENKSAAIVGMQYQAEALNRQLERFSSLRSRLLSTADPDAICPEIAAAITQCTSFQAAIIHTHAPEGTLRLAGLSGIAKKASQAVEERTRSWTPAHIQNLCSISQKIGQTSFLLPGSQENSFVFTVSRHQEDSFSAHSMPTFLIPLRSAAGTCLGSITLIPWHPGSTISLQDLARVESVAADLALAVELKSLHSQLVCSEKLAAIGQLVAGVAHELNNPLTAIMGFGELMGDAITSGNTRNQLQRLLSEARRMKRITDNLLRLSRKSSSMTPVSLAPVVREVLTLSEYSTRKSNVRVEVDIEPTLPSLAIGEDEIKQVLLNLLNNSCDALQGNVGSKHIRIRAHRSGAHALIRVEDNGPGFANLSRALEPFYTTKPAGKGTGLGLSICHNIAKRHGGDLRVENVEPHGGSVTIVIPVVEARSQALKVATAHA
jgi:two-component system, NtrC family, sensor kinase